jgi:hypothetical protein
MPKVQSTTELPVAASIVWNTIGNFNALPDWHPAVEKSQTSEEGGVTTRTLLLVGGGSIVEKLTKIDEHERVYSYQILSGPLPVADYEGTLRVKETNRGCEVQWSSEFQAKGAPEGDATAVIRGIYETGFENLRRMFGGS